MKKQVFRVQSRKNGFQMVFLLNYNYWTVPG